MFSGDNAVRRYVILVLASIVLIVIGYYAEHLNKLIGHLISEIGIAGLVGFIIAMTFERISTNEFRKLAQKERDDIKTDVFHYVYGRAIPENIRDEIDTQILRSDFVRLNMSVTFVLKVVTDHKNGEKYIKNSCKSAYSVKNLTAESKEFSLNHSVDKSPSPALADEVRFTQLSITNSANDFELSETDLRNTVTELDTEIALEGQKAIIPPEQATRVKVGYEAIRTLVGGRINFGFISHACDLDLTVIVPNHDLEIFVDTFSPYSLQETDRHDPSIGYHNWQLEKPLLPYQAIVVTWNPKGGTVSPHIEGAPVSTSS